MNEDNASHQEHAATAPETAGQRLRAARERAGWNQERLAGEMCLPLLRLQALEADAYEGFGGEVFVRGFLRRAAAVLNLPADELVDAYATASGARHPAEILPALPPGRLPRTGMPGWAGPATGAVMVAAVMALAWWTVRPAGEPAPLPLAEEPAGLPQGLAEAEQAPPVSAAETTELVVATPAESPADEPPAATGAALPGAVAQAPVLPAAVAEAPVRPEALAETPARPAPALELPVMAQLRFEFTEDCWVEVTDAREQRLAYRLYRAGDVARLSGVPPLAVFLGNAEGVRLTVDDEPVAVRQAATRNGTARLTVGGGTG
ncbi:RodZ domain-containing protein [Thioalkalivibrio sp. XN8]|uniref:RodZ domain-containing protein n=1 Tax=Thioalkalivibrio sp. XN8 TaxID=2712863 RepID=UPI0013ED859B|nr:RodZ domain-containing protein [Thioalkalivibrio sp. XN8]NGP53900.1 helix-turn-helix domain-containing protein [Thioalkalivibrio sp. XN8]